MDPNANLEELRSLAQTIVERDERDEGPDGGDVQFLFDQSRDAGRLAELFQALDEWITKGGFLPSAWKRS